MVLHIGIFRILPKLQPIEEVKQVLKKYEAIDCIEILSSSEEESKEKPPVNPQKEKSRKVYDDGEESVPIVTNPQGKEFIYYENLAQVRRCLGRIHPQMSKQQMYKELLKPYKHHIFFTEEPENGQQKEVYQ